jgi:hypothetical protein
MKFSKKLVLAMFALVFAVTAAAFAMAWFGKDPPDTVVAALFAWVSAEGGCLYLIKKLDTPADSKSKKEQQRLTAENAKLRRQLEKIQSAVGGDEK